MAEIQAAGQTEHGLLKDSARIEGEDNPADWVTKPRKVQYLAKGGFWQCGPRFLMTEFKSWPIKLSFRTDKLEGELVPKEVMSSTLATVVQDDDLAGVLERCRSLEKCHRVLAYILKWKNLNTLSKEPLTAEELELARIKWIQLKMQEDLEKSVCEQETSGKKV